MTINYNIKYDKDKPKAGLVLKGFSKSIKEVIKVGTDGAKEHGENTWQNVEYDRYVNALCRHLLDYLDDEKIDAESSHPTLAHIAWNALCLLELDLRRCKNEMDNNESPGN